MFPGHRDRGINPTSRPMLSLFSFALCNLLAFRLRHRIFAGFQSSPFLDRERAIVLPLRPAFTLWSAFHCHGMPHQVEYGLGAKLLPLARLTTSRLSTGWQRATYGPFSCTQQWETR